MDILQEFYYGNIRPNEHVFANHDAEYKKALDAYLKYAQEFHGALSEEQKKLLEKLDNANADYVTRNSIENFKLGFRLGVHMMCTCFGEDTPKLVCED